MDPLLTPMEEDEDRVYIPSQPQIENTVNQSFNIENNDTGILGPGVKTNGPKRMGSVAMMNEKLDTMLKVIISEKKTREVEREERMIERLERTKKRQRKEINNKMQVAMMELLIHKKRMILFGLPNDDSRAQWLTYMKSMARNECGCVFRLSVDLVMNMF
ncbi:hypothetical protein Cgig2_014320 [Carnegiea gigantea]|uniref:Uncharacterized protein n=1 Tax=Carnegiea gigantea TaxID=171969 RepID=A0A9Q1JLR0_9CARY|nr:hypothetical protein Cgig2_014320 [Carnegiea gigantea]